MIPLLTLITGDEILLVEEHASRLLKKATQDGFEERVIIEAETSEACDLFLSHRQNFSLFSTKKIIDIRFKQKMPAAFATLIIEACDQLDSNQVILLRMPKLSKAETQVKWYKAIEKTTGQKSQIITVWPLKQDGFLRWIQERFQQNNLKTTREAYALIASNTEGNLLAASQLIEKLKLLHSVNHVESSSISYESIQQALSDHSNYDVFELCDAALNQNPAHCLKILNTLQSQGSEPAVILWALMQDVRKLAILFGTDPRSRASVYQKQGIWSSRQGLFQKALQVINQGTLKKLILKSHQIDAIIKGIDSCNVWTVFEDFCLLLSNSSAVIARSSRDCVA